MTNCTCNDCPECLPPGRINKNDELNDAYDILAQQDLDDGLIEITRSQDSRGWWDDPDDREQER